MTEVRYHPKDQPIPQGWRFAGECPGHHRRSYFFIEPDPTRHPVAPNLETYVIGPCLISFPDGTCHLRGADDSKDFSLGQLLKLQNDMTQAIERKVRNLERAESD